MLRTRIKICGMSDPLMVKHAVDSGVDAIGVIFYAKSPRYVTVEQAKRIRDVIPPFVNLVGVFVNEASSMVNKLAEQVGLDLVQLHGDETPDCASTINTPYIKAIRAKSEAYILEQMSDHKAARGFLVDSYHKDKYGGTGELISLDIIPRNVSKPLIYAGGISPENVGDILRRKPYAIDVNSGVEAKEAIKDQKKITSLIKAVREFDNALSR